MAAPPTLNAALLRHGRALGWLNTVAFACTLAVGCWWVADAFDSLAPMLSTLLIASIWARVWRSPKNFEVADHPRRALALSVPLAATNGALAFAWVGRSEGDLGFFGGLFFGLTIGGLFWVPALVITLVLFAPPHWYAWHVARRGLAGEERGERVVGLTFGLINLCGAVLAGSLAHRMPPFQSIHPWEALMRVLLAVGATTGLGAWAIGTWRERTRRSFVRAVEAGAVPQMRVHDAPEGRTLVRVVPEGHGYRASETVEALAMLDDDGAVVHEADARTPSARTQGEGR